VLSAGIEGHKDARFEKTKTCDFGFAYGIFSGRFLMGLTTSKELFPVEANHKPALGRSAAAPGGAQSGRLNRGAPMKFLFCRVLPMLFYFIVFFPGNFSFAGALAELNRALLDEMQRVHGLQDTQVNAIRAIFAGSRVIGQGNPAVSEHPLAPGQ
jgi:hypothetical protein